MSLIKRMVTCQMKFLFSPQASVSVLARLVNWIVLPFCLLFLRFSCFSCFSCLDHSLPSQSLSTSLLAGWLALPFLLPCPATILRSQSLNAEGVVSMHFAAFSSGRLLLLFLLLLSPAPALTYDGKVWAQVGLVAR